MSLEKSLLRRLISQGINFSEAAIRAAKDSPVVRGTLFTDLRVKADELKGGKIPDEIHISGGPYALKRTILINRFNSLSPYLVDVIDGRLTVSGSGNPIAEVEYPPRPRYYDKKFEDGTLYQEVIPLRGHNLMAFNTL